MNIFQQFFAYLRIREAVRKADEAHNSTGKRYYVLPGANRSLVVMDRNNFRILKRKGYIPHKASTFDAAYESFYFTPHANGSGRLSDKGRKHKIMKYFSWYEAQLKEEKKRKREEKKRKRDGKV